MARPLSMQSAMEYLMTYGWAILVIAIVIAVLYYLGIFNSSSLAPRAQPGNCQVVRPDGAGTSSDVALSGECSGELPEYAAQFNGQSSYISTGASGVPLGSAARSAFAWIYVTAPPSSAGTIFSYGITTTPELSKILLNSGSDLIFNEGSGLGYITGTLAVASGSWYFVGYTYASGSNTVTLYVNEQSETGTLSGGALDTALPASNPASIGTAQTLANYFQGQIADVQVYNYSLSANEVDALYLEGIGGAPVNPADVVAWWPLNGNPNDYSGDLNSGTSYNVIYQSSWISYYTPP